MTLVLAVLLGIDAVLHGAIVVRFGVKGNEPPLVFGLIYAALAVATAMGVAHSLWAALIVALVGGLGLAAAYRKIPHEKAIERIILALNAVVVIASAYTLFLA